MNKWLTALWRRRHNTEAADKAEVEQIAALRQAAQRRRAEHAQETEQGALARSHMRVQEAEAAHAAALQVWNNKQFGLRVR